MILLLYNPRTSNLCRYHQSPLHKLPKQLLSPLPPAFGLVLFSSFYFFLSHIYFPDFSEKNLSNLSLGKAAVVGVIVGIIILISIISVLSFFGGGGSMRAYVEGEYAYNYELCWSGAFHNGDSTISISGCGTETFHCSDRDSCSINAQKDEDNSYELCVSIGSREACTTAGYGIAQV